METWMIWGVLAGILLILELLSGTFYLLMICFGFCAGALLALFAMSSSAQLIGAAVVGAGAALLLHRSKYGWKGNADASSDPNVNMDIGQMVQIDQWNVSGQDRCTARVSYRGANWDAETQGTEAAPGWYRIERVEGSRLIVHPVKTV